MPTSHPSDKLVRSQIYRRMEALTERANDKEEGRHNIIFAGDFNATLNKMDRASGNTNPMDSAHQTQIKEANSIPWTLSRLVTPGTTHGERDQLNSSQAALMT